MTSPSSRKRQLPRAETEAVKRRRLHDAGAESPSTPKALDAVASAISGALARDRQLQVPADQPQAPDVAKQRPAIKLAALRGTKWDTGDLGSAKPAKKPAMPSRASAKQSPAWAVRHRSGSQPNGGAGNGRESADELAAADPTVDTPTKPRPATSKAPPPRGILTPSKKRGRPSKSVTFNRGLDGEVYFQDLPKTPRAKKARGPKTRPHEDTDQDDEIRCAICSKADSKPPNEIILCDICDFAAHQECYEVPEIPEGDWLCKACAQEDVVATPSRLEAGGRDGAPAAEVPDIANLEQHLRAFQRVLVDRCCGRRRIRMFGHEEAYDKVRQLVEQTVVAGEGNSMLLMGPRGCGKMAMVEDIMVDLSREHRHLFHVVRLNGFIHTDNKVALKEIWRQLGKEMEVEDELVSRANYADTMASLLALLSHPSEITGTDEGVTSQSVVLVLDEFDMFAAHPRQTLLYNLLDIAQSRKAPVAVLGCTTRLDVVEMLEKRVKSRFSHRYVYLGPPRTLAAYWQICRQGLMINRTDVEREGVDAGLEGYDEFHRFWTRTIEELYQQRAFQTLLQYHFVTSKTAGAFLTEWILPLSGLTAGAPRLACPEAGAEAGAGAGLGALAGPDSRLQLLPTLSELDLGLLIAAARLDVVAHTDTVNLAMAYDEYSGLAGRQRAQTAAAGLPGARVWSRGVAGVAWERLVSLGLLVPAGGGGGRPAAAGHGGLEAAMWRVAVTLEEIPGAARLGAVQARWCREV